MAWCGQEGFPDKAIRSDLEPALPDRVEGLVEEMFPFTQKTPGRSLRMAVILCSSHDEETQKTGYSKKGTLCFD